MKHTLICILGCVRTHGLSQSVILISKLWQEIRNISNKNIPKLIVSQRDILHKLCYNKYVLHDCIKYISLTQHSEEISYCTYRF